jgi:hypothetical protein
MKAYGGVDVQIHIFFTSALVGGNGGTAPNIYAFLIFFIFFIEFTAIYFSARSLEPIMDFWCSVKNKHFEIHELDCILVCLFLVC